MNPYESPAYCEQKSTVDIGRIFFGLLLVAFVLLIPVTCLAVWTGYSPERFWEFLVAIPLSVVLHVAGIVICFGGTTGKLDRQTAEVME